MKNISKTIASIGLSVLALSAMAQTPFTGSPESKYVKGRPIYGPSVMSRHRVSKISAFTNSFQMFYPSTDNALQTAYSTSLGWFTDQLNNRFTEADTNLTTVPRQNFNLVHSASVAFDTLVDASSNVYPGVEGVRVDTLWVECAYKNTSGNNDTLVFSIDKVSPTTGLPTATTYTTINVPLYKGVTFATTTGNAVLPGTNLDTIYVALAVPTFTLPPGVIHFAVNVTFNGSKADTFQIGYGFPLSTCPGGACGTYDYANPGTGVGDLYTDTKTIHVNSYAWMFQEYYSNVPTMQPSANGTILSFYKPNFYEWNTCPGTCTTDTMFFYEQDYAIAASVETSPTVLGVENINTNGLAVAQNYPNPFNKTTQITYSLTKSSDITFSVYDMTGRVLVNNVITNSAPGEHIINLDANSFSPGVYFYTFNVNGSTVTKKMVITE